MFDKFLLFCIDTILIDSSFLSRILFNIILCLVLLCVCEYILKIKKKKNIIDSLKIKFNSSRNPLIIEYLKNRKLKENRRKRREEIFKTITPHLTLYYPLETALVSVLIRFMGILLLFLIFICLSITIICSIYNVSFYSIILKLILKNICFFLIIGSSIFHIYKAYKHF